MTKQPSIGAWVKGLGQLLLVAILVIYFFDISGLASRGGLSVPLYGYLTGIFSGVAMQFIGSAIPHMKFNPGQ